MTLLPELLLLLLPSIAVMPENPVQSPLRSSGQITIHSRH